MNNKAEGVQIGKKELHQVRLPGFIIEEEVGLGDVIKKVTYAFGIRPCSGCERRASALNNWLVFKGQTK